MRIDLSNIETNNNDYSPLPSGEYNVLIASTAINDTKDGMGKILKIEFAVSDGRYKGRKIWENIFFFTTDETKQKGMMIGRQRLKTFLLATKYQDPNKPDLTDLNGLMVKVSVEVEEAHGYSARNVIKGYSKVELIDHLSIPF